MSSTESAASPATEFATLAGGCFWCLEAVFLGMRGVVSVASGYMGGHTAHPNYRDVCNGNTGHAEVVRVEFDPSVVTYRDLLDVFFTIHDPSTLNRQGNDTGTQYRSAIFHHSEQQREDAIAAMAAVGAEKWWPAPLVTELEPASVFHAAEAYHDDYFARNPEQPYCQFVVAPKVAKFRKRFFDRLKKSA